VEAVEAVECMSSGVECCSGGSGVESCSGVFEEGTIPLFGVHMTGEGGRMTGESGRRQGRGAAVATEGCAEQEHKDSPSIPGMYYSGGHANIT
jgi:hypothetical protein